MKYPFDHDLLKVLADVDQLALLPFELLISAEV
jgi:hypothetical protein